jgi:hypothetical protein
MKQLVAAVGYDYGTEFEWVRKEFFEPPFPGDGRSGADGRTRRAGNALDCHRGVTPHESTSRISA